MKTERFIILITILLVVFAWLTDSLLDFKFYDDRSFAAIAFTNIPGHEIVERVAVILVIIILGLIISRQVYLKNKALARLAHVNNVLTSIRNINQLITRITDDEDELIRQACAELTRTRGFYTSLICLTYEDGALLNFAESGYGDGFNEVKSSLEQNQLPGCIQTALKNDGVSIIMPGEKSCRECLGPGRFGDRAALAVRLKHGDRIFGALVVSGPPEYIMDQKERGLLSEIAADISLALNNIEQRNEHQRYVKNLAVSRQWLSTTLKSIGDAVICADENGLVTFINAVAEKLTGWTADEAMGRRLPEVFKIVNQFSRQPVENPVDRVFREGIIVGLANHTVLIAKDGAEYPIEDSGAPIKSDEGKIAGAVLVFHDVTERRNAELEIRRQRDLARQYLDLAGTIFVAIDRNMLVTLINRKGCEILGYREDEVIGRNWFDLTIPMEIRETVKGVFTQLIRGEMEPVEYFENVVLRKDGQKRIIAWHNSVIRDNDGNITHSLSSGEDITERKAALEALKKSENQFRTLVEIIPHGIKTVDLDGKITFANESYHRIFGYENGELLGTSFLEVSSDPEQLEKDKEYFRTILRTQPRPQSMVRTCKTKNGDEITIQLDWTYLYDGEQRLLGFVDVVTDITERMRARNALEEEKERLAVTLSSIGDGVIATDITGRIVLCNHVAEDLTGWKSEEAFGHKLDEVFHIINEKTRERCENPVDKVIKYNTAIGLANHTVLIARDGTQRAIADSGAPIRTKTGAILGVVLVFRDVTETNRLRDLAERAQRLETAGRIAGQVAHDFNNLLAPLMAYPELIRDAVPPDSHIIGYLNSMERAATQIAEINQQLLTLGRRGHYNQEPLNMNTIVREVIKQHVSSHVGIKVSTNLEEDLFLFKGGASQIFRVVSNLVINALDAMKDTGGLFFRTENFYVDRPLGKNNNIPTGEYVKMTIADTGCGIPPEAVPRIFDPFFTTKSSDRRRGSGLGLSVVHAVVEDHNGYIDFESEPGQGTVFYLYFPVTRETVEEPDKETVVGGQERILVVDDDELQRTVCLILLRNLGYDAQAVKSGEAAVEFFREERADLVILDMIMTPGIDGTETLNRILKLIPDQKALIVSGFAHSERIEEALQIGAGAFVRKPLTLKSLAHAVRKELDRKQEVRVRAKDEDFE